MLIKYSTSANLIPTYFSSNTGVSISFAPCLWNTPLITPKTFSLIAICIGVISRVPLAHFGLLVSWLWTWSISDSSFCSSLFRLKVSHGYDSGFSVTLLCVRKSRNYLHPLPSWIPAGFSSAPFFDFFFASPFPAPFTFAASSSSLAFANVVLSSAFQHWMSSYLHI